MDCDLEKRLIDIENRLSNIEAHLVIKTPNPAASVPPEQKLTYSQPSVSPRLPTISKPGNWLGLTAIICFVLAAGFIIKLSIDSGWLTPARQIGIAVLFGFSLIGAGFALLSSDRSYASLLPATGIIVLFLSAFAAHRYYFLISPAMALLATSGISALCIWFYMRIRHDSYAIIAAIGAYVAPVLLELNTGSIFSLYYFLFCSLTFATISIWVRSRLFIVIAAYLAILVTGLIGLDLHADDIIACTLFLHFLIFSVGTFLYTYHTSLQLSEREAWGFFPVLLLFYSLEYYFIDRAHPGLAPWLSLAFAGFLLGLYLSAKKLFPGRVFNSQGMLLAFTTLVLFHSVYLELLPYDARPWLFVLFVLIFTFYPQKLLAQKKSSTFIIPIFAILTILAIEYVSMVFHLIVDYKNSWLVVSMAAFASIWFALIRQTHIVMKNTEMGYLLLGAAHLLAVTALYQLTTDHGSLAVSASWLLYAICVISVAFIRKDKIMAKSALFVLSFAAAKALLYDASSAPTIIRILCLLLTGAVLYCSGFLFRRIAQWETKKK